MRGLKLACDATVHLCGNLILITQTNNLAAKKPARLLLWFHNLLRVALYHIIFLLTTRKQISQTFPLKKNILPGSVKYK